MLFGFLIFMLVEAAVVALVFVAECTWEAAAKCGLTWSAVRLAMVREIVDLLPLNSWLRRDLAASLVSPNDANDAVLCAMADARAEGVAEANEAIKQRLIDAMAQRDHERAQQVQSVDEAVDGLPDADETLDAPDQDDGEDLSWLGDGEFVSTSGWCQ